MTASWRLVVTVVLGTLLAIDTAALVCVSLDLSGTWLAVVMAASGPFWVWMTDRGIGKVGDAWKSLQGAPKAPRGGDGVGCSTLAASDATLEGEDHGA